MCVALDRLVEDKKFLISFGGGALSVEETEDGAKGHMRSAAANILFFGKLDQSEHVDVKMCAPPNADVTLFDLHFKLVGDITNTPLIMRYHHGHNRFTYHLPHAASQHETLSDLADAVMDVLNTLVLRPAPAPAPSGPAGSLEA